MGIVERDFDSEEIHPIDIVETLAEERSWDFDRIADDQIAMAIEGSWRTYSVTLAWSARDETLRLICAFDMAPPARRLAALHAAMCLANDRCWTGAFVLWREQKLMGYRYGLNLSGGAPASSAPRSTTWSAPRSPPASASTRRSSSSPGAARRRRRRLASP